MMTYCLRLSLLILALNFSQCEESTPVPHSLPALSKESPEPKEVQYAVFLTIVVDTYIVEPSGAVSREGDIQIMTEADFEKTYHRKLDDLDKVSIEKRGYVKQVMFRVRGTF